MTTDGLVDEISRHSWWHSIDFGSGIVSPGKQPVARLRQMADIYFAEPITGKSVLDIGANNGFHSIEAMRRGARSVTAVDLWDQGGETCIGLVKQYIAPDLITRNVSVYDIGPENVGRHDVVLFAGVLYHLRHPLYGIEKVASVTGELLIVETELDARFNLRPAMVMYPGRELNDDPSNWWGPNRACVEAMLRDVGFSTIRFTPHPSAKRRGIFHARRG